VSDQAQGPSVEVPDAPDPAPPGYPPAGYAPAQYAAAPTPPPRTETFAATSLVLGILGLALPCFWLFPAPQVIAVILGHIALAQTRTFGTRGRGMATTGLVLGYLGIAFALGCLAALLVGALTSAPAPA